MSKLNGINWFIVAVFVFIAGDYLVTHIEDNKYIKKGYVKVHYGFLGARETWLPAKDAAEFIKNENK